MMLTKISVGLVLLCVVASCIAETHRIQAGTDKLKLVVDTKSGGYVIYIDGKPWFTGATYAVHSKRWYLSTDGTLVYGGYKSGHATDVWGDYQWIQLLWSTFDIYLPFQTTFAIYEDVPVITFQQYFPKGVPYTSINDNNNPCTIFPSLAPVGDRAFLSYYGGMSDNKFLTGVFPGAYKGGINSGVLSVFDRNLTAAVLSPLENIIAGVTNFNDVGGTLITGIQGELKEIPEDFKFTTILYVDKGINNAFMGWGDLLLAKYGKTRALATANPTLQFLGYSTSGFYYNNPLTGNATHGNYQNTLEAVSRYSASKQIPYGYYMLDKWWYGADLYNGVRMWEDSPLLLSNRFPKGLVDLKSALDTTFAAALGKFSTASPYTKNGTYGFVVDSTGALPTRAAFWDYLFSANSKWGLSVVYQTEISDSIELLTAAFEDASTVKTWLAVQGNAAKKRGLSIQYAGESVTVAVNSITIPAVTQSQATIDYSPSTTSHQWMIGATSMLLWAVGLRPYKGTFFSTNSEVTYSPTSPFYQFREPYPMTHFLVSVLSTGPVAPSDGLGGSDLQMLSLGCMPDGTLLKPDRPATLIDSAYLQRTFGKDTDKQYGPDGEVWTTYTTIDGTTFHYVFSNLLRNPYNFTVNDLLLEESKEWITWEFDDSNPGQLKLLPFDAENPITLLPSQDYGDFHFWIVAPSYSHLKWVFLGEMGKLIPFSKQRVVNFAATSEGFELNLRGVAEEVISLAFLSPEKSMATFSCEIPQSGMAIFQLQIHQDGLCFFCTPQ